MQNRSLLILVMLVTVSLLTGGCDTNESKDSSDFPDSPEEIERAAQNTERIAQEGGIAVEQEIASAFQNDGLVDPNSIADEIESIDGARSAEPTSSGTGIVVEQDDGTYSNVLVVQQDDSRLFEETNGRSENNSRAESQGGTMEKSALALKQDQDQDQANFPTNKNAIILAPFQRSFAKDLETISDILESAGFSVDMYTNESATLDRFRADFLKNYGAIFIDTHGAANFMTRDGTLSTVLLTGEEYSANLAQSLSEAERRSVAVGVADGDSYFALSVPWLEETMEDEFPKSWFFASACETSMLDSGPASLSQALFQLGTGGYNGYDANINVTLAGPTGERLTSLFGSGMQLTEASEATRNDLGLQAKAWFLRILLSDEDEDEARVELLDNSQRTSQPYHLFDPEEIVSTATVNPSFGPPGTDVVYEVNIRSQFASNVARVEFDIDNTDEHLTMNQVSTTLWQRDGLSAPTAEEYPRVDTFTFTAWDANDSVLDRGSATFTIQEPAASQPSTKQNNSDSRTRYAIQ